MTGISFTPKFAISPYVAPALVNCTPKSEGNGWRFNTINLVACEVWEIDINTLKGSTRKKNAVRARAFCYKMLMEQTTLTQVEIAKRYGNKNHSTVYHGLNVIANAENGYDPAFLYELNVAREKLNQYLTNH